jgi:tRNA splicing ligase
MQIEKARLKQSVESLTKRAEECLEAARTQHVLAERQQVNADKLAVIGQTLETDAAGLNGEVEMVSQRASAPIMGP